MTPKDSGTGTHHNIDLWQAMAPAFPPQGVELYLRDDAIHAALRRPPDQHVLPHGSYETEPGTWNRSARTMQQQSPSVYPGVLLSDGSDVFVRIVSKGSVPSRQLQVRRYLSTEPQRSDPRNHTIPLISELLYDDWMFVTMPRFSPSPIHEPYWTSRWFSTVGREVVDFLRQTLEGRVRHRTTQL